MPSAAGRHKIMRMDDMRSTLGRGYYSAIAAARGDAAGAFGDDQTFRIVSGFDDDGRHYFAARDTTGLNQVGATGVGRAKGVGPGIGGSGGSSNGSGGQMDEWADTAQDFASENKWVLLAVAAGAAYYLWGRK